MNRFLTFHTHGTSNNEAQMLPAYYLDAEYVPVAVRIRAEVAPSREAKINIYDDGVTIFNNRTATAHNFTTGVDITGDTVTYASLDAGQNSDEYVGDFSNDVLERDSWVTCKLIDGGSGENFTVQLELTQTSEEDEE